MKEEDYILREGYIDGAYAVTYRVMFQNSPEKTHTMWYASKESYEQQKAVFKEYEKELQKRERDFWYGRL